MLEAFKLKPFDLEPIYTSWPDGPRFVGNPKQDPKVDDWLGQIKDGCLLRKVPKEYWHKVAQYFMGEKARARLNELKVVMGKVHGGKYRWNWKKFKVAMRNMGWDINTEVTEPIKVQAKSSGVWWLTRSLKKGELESEAKDVEEEYQLVSPICAGHVKAKSESAVVSSQDKTPKPPIPSRSNSTDTVTTIANAPTWLLNACSALDYLTTEHPKVMSTISAVLITVGSIPAIPAITAGAGGAILASGAAHAAGALAVGVGSWLQAQQNGQLKAQLDDQSKITADGQQKLQGDAQQKVRKKEQLKVEGLPQTSSSR